MSNALVLGGSVFVGRRLVRALTELGVDVTVLNRGKTPDDLPAGVKRLVADRTDNDSMTSALGASSWDAVYDVSGFVMAAGGSDFQALLDLLDGRTKSYVYVSSIMAYDQAQIGVMPWTEDLPTNSEGVHSYGGFKALAESTMLDRHARTGFPVVVVRPAAIYGPDNNIYDMETPMFLRLLQRRPILVPHGGLVAGSYGHVDDLCSLMTAIPDQPQAFGQVINATADGVTVSRYVEVLARVVGVEPNMVAVPDDLLLSLQEPVFGHLFGHRHHAVLSTEKARVLLGHRSRYDLFDGHEHTFAWFLAHGLNKTSTPLVDPVWRATWNFDAEAACAASLGWKAP